MSELIPGRTLASGAGTGLGTSVSLWNDKSLFRKFKYGVKICSYLTNDINILGEQINLFRNLW